MDCACAKDGFCERYQREMHGRMRELCSGINVDIGTAEAFRQQWVIEAKPSKDTPRRLVLKTAQAPGDALVMTAAIWSLHRANPGKFLTSIESLYPEVFEGNPDVSNGPGEELQMHYPAIHQSNYRGIHFMQGYCEFLADVLGVKVPLLTNRPRLYFKAPPPREEAFWLICSGGKLDFTNKLWGSYQEVVDSLQGKIAFIQVGNLGMQHHHPKLRGVADFLGKTSLRELFELVRRCSGALCGVSLMMHVAAALEKPAIVIAGGREPVQWNAYPKQQYLHTVGMLPCCADGGCWRSRVLPLGDNAELDRDTCERPVKGVPECMTQILPGEVAKRVLSLQFNRPSIV